MGPRMGRDFARFIPFLAIAAAGAFGGVGPGLLTTAIACAAATHLFGGDGGKVAEAGSLMLLIAQGGLISLLGEGLLQVRRRAHRGEIVRRQLEKQIIEIGEDERRRIGHDLHDGLGQHLTGISLLSESMAQQVAAGKAPASSQAETVTRLVSEAVCWTRDLARNLWPATLERDGFVAAMDELAATAGSLLRIHCTWEYDGKPVAIEPRRAIHLYRIVQEALSNSVKHGKAPNATITMGSNNSSVLLVVLDDGCGLSEKTSVNPGLGLRIMNYRANLIGASLKVERATSAGGTRVTCRCPIHEPKVAEAA